MACPIKNTQEYKNLVNQLGSEEAAIYTWKVLGNKYPKTLTSLSELKTKLRISNAPISRAAILGLATRVGAYNKANGTSHSFVKKQIGESDNYIITLKPSYVSAKSLAKQKTLFDKADIDNTIDVKGDGIFAKPESNEYYYNGELYPSIDDINFQSKYFSLTHTVKIAGIDVSNLIDSLVSPGIFINNYLIQGMNSLKRSAAFLKKSNTVYEKNVILNTINSSIKAYKDNLDRLNIKGNKEGYTELILKRLNNYNDKINNLLELHSIIENNLFSYSDLSVSAGSQILYQIIGEQGAKRLDDAAESNIRLNNLAIAKNMESNQFEPRSIRMATGWEKGADGLWRYEIEDVNVTNDKLNSLQKSTSSSYVLYDMAYVIGEDSALIKAYPDLKNWKVYIVGPLLDYEQRVQGWANNNSKRIAITPYAINPASTFVHELQHAVQHYEQFPTGGNESSYTSASFEELKKLAKTVLDRLDNDLEANREKLKIEEASLNKLKSLANKINEIRKNYNLASKLSGKEYIEEISKVKQEAEDIVNNNNLKQEYGIWPHTITLGTSDFNENYRITSLENTINTLNSSAHKILLDKTRIETATTAEELQNLIGSEISYKFYKGLGGEVEARNVQTRMNLTEEERQETLLSETQDVASEDQTFIFDNNSNSYSLADGDFTQAKGAFDTLNNIIFALTNPDISTFPHELAHSYEQFLTEEERSTILNWANTDEWSTETSEAFAKGFEAYLAEGGKTNDNKLNNIFQKFAKWLADIYTSIAEALGINPLNDKMRSIYANMLNSEHISEETKEQIKVAEEIENQAVAEQTSQPVTENQYTEEQPNLESVDINNEESVEDEVTSPTGNLRVEDFDGVFLLVDENNIPFGDIYDTEEEANDALSNYINVPQQVENEEVNASNNIEVEEPEEVAPEQVEENPVTKEKPKTKKGRPKKTIKNTTEITEPLTEDDVRVSKGKGEYEGAFVIIAKQNGEQIGSIFDQNGDWIDYDSKNGEFISDDKQDAVSFLIDRYNDENNLTRENKNISEKRTFYKIKVKDASGNKVDVVAEHIIDPEQEGANSKLLLFEDVHGNLYKRVASSVEPATEAEYENQAPLAKPTPKFNVGDDVQDTDGNVSTINNIIVERNPDTDKFEILYETSNGVFNQDLFKNKGSNTIEDSNIELSAKQQKIKNTANVIASRFQNLFGNQITMKADIYDFDAPAKFQKGVVLINLGYFENHPEVSLYEAVSHEFMHPLIKAISVSNKGLYDSLVRDLKENHKDVLTEVKESGNYNSDEYIDEALVTYLGREIGNSFTEIGEVNMDYVKQRPLIERFLNWLRNTIDLITGKKKLTKLKDFVKNANSQNYKHTEYVRSYINDFSQNNKQFADLFKNFKNTELSRKITFLNKKENQDKIKEALGNDYGTLRQILDDYKSNSNIFDKSFNFELINDPNNSIDIVSKGDGTYDVFIDASLEKDVNLPAMLNLFAEQELSGEDLEKFKNVVSENLLNDGNKNRELQVGDINPLFDLTQLSNMVLTNIANTDALLSKRNLSALENINSLTKDEIRDNAFTSSIISAKTPIQFTSEELTAINGLDAYMKIDSDIADKKRKAIVQRLNALENIAKSRMGNEAMLKANFNDIRFKNNEYSETESAAFIEDYMRSAQYSIYLMYNKYNELLNDIKSGEVNNSKLAKDYNTITNLLGFYRDFKNLANPNNFNMKNPEDAELFAKVQNAISMYDRIKDSVGDTAINIVIDWFKPRVELYNEQMAKQGYTDEKYKLDSKKLYDYFKYGVGEDANTITYWLGTNINSKDPINAMFANSLADSISYNHFGVTYDAGGIGVAEADFEKRTGIKSKKDKADFYKKNYLRKVKVKQKIYNELTDEYEVKDVEKWAFHQEFYWDLYDQDLETFKKSLKEPKTQEQSDANDLAIDNWKKQQGFSIKNGKEVLTNQKYINNNYKALLNDSYFSTLSLKYEQSNLLYGEGKLQYGIIPQEYDVKFLDKITNSVKDITDEKSVKSIYEKCVDKLRLSLQNSTNKPEQLNLDDTIHRNISSTFNRLKDDDILSYDLSQSVINMMVEANRYNVLRNTQQSANILITLLKGNEFLGIKGRTFTKNNNAVTNFNYNRYIKSKRELDVLDKKRANGETIDQNYYDKVKAVVDKGFNKGKSFDKYLNKFIPAKTERFNDMLISQIEDAYYGQQEDDFIIGKTISGKKLLSHLSYYTSVISLSGNLLAGVSNVTIGNMQLLTEAFGRKYFGKKDLAKAEADYIKNIHNYVADLKNPIKSKDTQLLLMLDAMQGEIEDNLGNRITGSLASKFFSSNSLFVLTHAGEHQIQTVGMKAMLYGRKVTTNSGETINLYDAFVKDESGRYKLRTDLKDFNKNDLTQFISNLHGVNRALNGNYSDLHKTMLQRKWYGNAIAKFRKYIYTSMETRWSNEKVNYEQSTPEVGYLNYFFREYIGKNTLKLITKGTLSQYKLNGMKPHERYAFNKAMTEISAFFGIALLAVAMFGIGGDDDDKQDLSATQKFILLQMDRLHSDLGMFSFSAPTEFVRQVKNPTATLRAANYIVDFTSQLFSPSEEYTATQGGHEIGDSKLMYKASKLIPLYKLVNSMKEGGLEDQIDNQLSYINLSHKAIEGVTPKKSIF